MGYLYSHDRDRFEQKIADMHNTCFDKYEKYGLYHYYFNTCLACKDYGYVVEYYTRLSRKSDRKYVVGSSCNISYENTLHSLKDTFKRGQLLDNYLYINDLIYEGVEERKADIKQIAVDRELLQKQLDVENKIKREEEEELLPEIKKNCLLHWICKRYLNN